MPLARRSRRSAAGRTCKSFVELPYRLHAGTPWIPPLKLERYAYLSRQLNPFFKHGDAEFFLARRDGRVVGRISAQIRPRTSTTSTTTAGASSASSSSRTTRRSLDALLDAAARVAARRSGRDRMIGPVRLHHQRGVRRPDRGLRARADDPPALAPAATTRQRVEAAGLVKAMDVFHWNLRPRRSRRRGCCRSCRELAQRSHDKHGITHPQDVVLAPAAQDLKEFAEDLQRRLVQELGLLPYDDARPRRSGDQLPADLRQALVHARRERQGDRGRGDHDPRHQPGATRR